VDCETFFHPETKLPVGFESPTTLARTGMFRHAPQIPDHQRGRFRELRSTRGGRKDGGARAENVIRGFKAMHRLFSARGRDRDLEGAIQRFQNLPVRIIYRPTSYYVRVLEASLSPNIIRTLETRARFLRSRCNDGLCSPKVAESETSQLLAGDIPIFIGRSDRPLRELTPAGLAQALNELRNVSINASCPAILSSSSF
jgi:hypothetical protein